jgi:hypothetical protein
VQCLIIDEFFVGVFIKNGLLCHVLSWVAMALPYSMHLGSSPSTKGPATPLAWTDNPGNNSFKLDNFSATMRSIFFTALS